VVSSLQIPVQQTFGKYYAQRTGFTGSERQAEKKEERLNEKECGKRKWRGDRRWNH
jgi:hypothetical protein